jgi:hypothetical protein
MKKIFAPRTLVAVFVFALVMELPLTVHATDFGFGHCTIAAVAGKWTFTTNGSVLGVGPVAAVGSYVGDGSGNLVGSQTRSLNGDVADETFTGTLKVNPDCTGTDVIQVFESGQLVRTSTLSVVYDYNGRNARAIFRSLVLPNGTSLPTVLTIDAKRVIPSDDH